MKKNRKYFSVGNDLLAIMLNSFFFIAFAIICFLAEYYILGLIVLFVVIFIFRLNFRTIIYFNQFYFKEFFIINGLTKIEYNNIKEISSKRKNKSFVIGKPVLIVYYYKRNKVLFAKFDTKSPTHCAEILNYLKDKIGDKLINKGAFENDYKIQFENEQFVIKN